MSNSRALLWHYRTNSFMSLLITVHENGANLVFRGLTFIKKCVHLAAAKPFRWIIILSLSPIPTRCPPHLQTADVATLQWNGWSQNAETTNTDARTCTKNFRRNCCPPLKMKAASSRRSMICTRQLNRTERTPTTAGIRPNDLGLKCCVFIRVCRLSEMFGGIAAQITKQCTRIQSTVLFLY